MEHTIRFVEAHGYLLLFAFVFAEQLGIPIPATPILLAGGALTRMGKIDLATAIGVCTLASLLADYIWYELGRRKGGGIMKLLCRISLEPDSCVRSTEDFFARHGARALTVAKFIPGLNTAAPPMAGVFHMRRRRFVLFDTAGAMIWSGAFLILGYIFGNQIEDLVEAISRFGISIGVLLVLALAAYIGRKYLQRRKFLSELRIAKITPAELFSKLSSGEDLVIVDLRHVMDFESEPTHIPGALHLPVEHFERRKGEIPRDREIILYCT